ncbi:hypothetical protein D3C86_1440130 [compost metagenome]
MSTVSFFVKVVFFPNRFFLQRDISGKFLSVIFFGNNIDDSCNSIVSIFHAHRTFYNLYALYVIDIDFCKVYNIPHPLIAHNWNIID